MIEIGRLLFVYCGLLLCCACIDIGLIFIKKSVHVFSVQPSCADCKEAACRICQQRGSINIFGFNLLDFFFFLTQFTLITLFRFAHTISSKFKIDPNDLNKESFLNMLYYVPETIKEWILQIPVVNLLQQNIRSVHLFQHSVQHLSTLSCVFILQTVLPV